MIEKETESAKQMIKALMNFHDEIGKLKKSSTNPHFKSKYADLDEVLSVIKEPLKNNGLLFMHLPYTKENRVGVKLVLSHVEGGQISCSFDLDPNKPGPQPAGSALTYCRRYTLVSMLGLSQEDDDGNSNHEPVREKAKAKQTTEKNEKEGHDVVRSILTMFDQATNMTELREAAERTNKAAGKLSDNLKNIIKASYQKRKTQ